MPEAPTEEFAIWLLNARRERWGLVPLLLSAGLVMAVVQVTGAYHASLEYFWLGVGIWGIAFMVLYHRFAKWASDPATVVVSAQGLAVRSEATSYSLAVNYSDLKDCTYGMIKDAAWLRMEYSDGRKVTLRTICEHKVFGQMATSCEQRFNAYWLQVRLSWPRARR